MMQRCSSRHCERPVDDAFVTSFGAPLCLVCGIKAQGKSQCATFRNPYNISRGARFSTAPLDGVDEKNRSDSKVRLNERFTKKTVPVLVLPVAVKDNYLSKQYICELCNQKTASIFCLDCVEHYCIDCAEELHCLEDEENKEKAIARKRDHRWQPINIRGPAPPNPLLPTTRHASLSDYSHIRVSEDTSQPASTPTSDKVEKRLEVSPKTVAYSQFHIVKPDAPVPEPRKQPFFPLLATLEKTPTEESVHSSAVVQQSDIFNNDFEMLHASISDLACQEHINEPVRYFCFTCERECVCAECVINGLHEAHIVQLIRDAYPAIKAKHIDFWESAEADLIAECGYVESHLQEKRVEWAMTLHECMQQVDYIMVNVKNKLLQKEEELLNRFTDYYQQFSVESDEFCYVINESVKELKSLLEKYRGNRTMLDVVDSANFYADHHKITQKILEKNYPEKYSHLPASRESKLQLAAQASQLMANQARRLQEACRSVAVK